MTKELLESSWFTGPSFLWQKELPNKYIKVNKISTEDPELKVTSFHSHNKRRKIYLRTTGKVLRLDKSHKSHSKIKEVCKVRTKPKGYVQGKYYTGRNE